MSKSILVGLTLSIFFVFCLLLSISIGLSAHDKIEDSISNVESSISNVESSISNVESSIDDIEWRMR